MRAKVSIIIPAYNKAQLTARTVDSVLRQTYLDYEVIVVDDGSTDNTRDIMSAYGNKITYVYKMNGGACSARNEGIRLASGEYIAFLDCDDLYLPDKIEVSVRYLENNPLFGFVHTAAYFIDAQDRVLDRYSHPESRRKGDDLQRLIMKNFVCNSTVVVRKRICEQAGLFDEHIFIPADWDMWLRFTEIAPMGFIDVPLTMYRVTDNYTFNKIEKAQAEEKYVIEKFLERNSHLKDMRGVILSQWHLRFAQCYLLKDNLKSFRNLLVLAVRSNIFNIKAWVQILFFLFAPTVYRAKLHRKIIRHGS